MRRDSSVRPTRAVFALCCLASLVLSEQAVARPFEAKFSVAYVR